MAYDIGPVIGIEGEKEFRNSIKQINENLKTLGTEMKAVTSQYDKNDNSTEALTAKNEVLNKLIEQQRSKLSELERGLSSASERYGENDRVTQGWQRALNQATADLNNMERQLRDNTEALEQARNPTENMTEEIEELGDNADNAGQNVFTLGDLIKANLISEAIIGGVKALGTAIMGIGSAIIGTVEDTKEYRKEISLLSQNADDAGLGIDNMKDKLSNLTALTGDSGASVEALSNLMATGFDEQGITKAVEALSGAVIKFPDTLKIEGLADGLQETLATGAAAGTFAELIERMGGNLEEFNESMAGATTEAKKQQLALDWLAKSGLADINAEYQKANKAMLSAEEAQFKLNDAIAEFANNIEPLVATLKGGLADVLTDLVGAINGDEKAMTNFSQSIKTLAKDIINAAEGAIPIFAETFSTLIPTLVLAITENLPMIFDTGSFMISELLFGLMEMLPGMVQSGLDIVVSLAKGISEQLPYLIPVIVDTVLLISQTLINNLDMVINAGLDILFALTDGIIDALPTLIEEVPRIINEFSDSIYDQLPRILKAGIDILMALIKGIIDSIPTLIANLPQIIMAIVNVITLYNWANLGKSVITKLGDGIKAMNGNIANIAKNIASGVGEAIAGIFKGGFSWGKNLISSIGSGASSLKVFLSNSVKSIGTGAINSIKSAFSGAFDIGKNLIKGIWNGVASLKDWILDNIGNIAGNIIATTKKKFGINSPSKVFQDEVGKNLALGLGLGFTDEMKNVTDEMTSSIPTNFDTELNISSFTNPMPAVAQMNTVSTPSNIILQLVADGKKIAEVVAPYNDIIQGNSLRLVGRGLA